eukprot:TRINITY_DN11853_c0_g1_i1.p1 TRINITY_DN11853_c0_g1~~TRINITY_DN11853_c0_g1_i1.p1  ORF type:complete len:246 (+),score=54.25 TRINITY_DN11853_c0_g1_i1:67-804(+)
MQSVVIAALFFSLVCAIQVPNKALPALGDTECEVCWDAADDAIESWLEIALYGGTFAGCADFCNNVENWGYACIVVCSAVGDETFLHLLTSLDLDPVYVCQLLSACPIDDCGPVCGTIDRFYANPGSVEAPAVVHFPTYYQFTKVWKGTGVLYFQVEQCDASNNCVFVANNFQLLEPNGQLGNFTTTFQFNADCGDIGTSGTYKATLSMCEGNCDEYGVARHPHTALYSQASTTFVADFSNCPDK